ncbi:MAG: hypothetical protein HY069_00730 [Chlamydiia bacterium]|nr:hypothetical protein [Chlamydiia bacterium]
MPREAVEFNHSYSQVEVASNLEGVILPRSHRVLSLLAVQEKISRLQGHIAHLEAYLSGRRTHGGTSHRRSNIAIGDQIQVGRKRLEVLKLAETLAREAEEALSIVEATLAKTKAFLDDYAQQLSATEAAAPKAKAVPAVGIPQITAAEILRIPDRVGYSPEVLALMRVKRNADRIAAEINTEETSRGRRLAIPAVPERIRVEVAFGRVFGRNEELVQAYDAHLAKQAALFDGPI